MNASDNLRTAVGERIRESIISGDFAPGSRINESQLSVAYGVSRTPLREALFTIERLGLLRSDPRRGFFVTPLSAREVRELYPLGRALDLLAVRTAGEMPPAAVARLADINAAFRSKRSDPHAAQLADRCFHRAIVDRCPNRRLITMLESVQAGLERYERMYMSDADDVDRSAAKHDEIVEAFRHDDLDRAERVLGHVWDYSARRLLVALGEQP
jgi:DNA-binding GntR family transcriptional regulator